MPKASIYTPSHTCRVFFICALLCFAGLADLSHAASVKIPVLATNMQEQYAQIQSFRASFTQKLTHRESGAEDMRHGTLMFQRPLRIRWETDKPDQELLVVTEKEIWNYLPEEHSAVRYAPALAKDSRSIIQVVTGQSRLDKDFAVREIGRDGDLVTLSLFPNEPTMQFTQGTLWINAKTKFIHRVEVIDFYGNSNDITLSDMAVNLSLPESTFAFTPPPDTRIEDRTKAEGSSNPLLQ